MKILFTICGRAGSKGIKNKNIRSFLGRPLALYTLSTIDLFLKKSPEIKYDIILNTDSMELKDIFDRNPLRQVKFIERKAKLAGDRISKMEVIKDSLICMEKKGNRYDIVIDLDITSPLRTENDLREIFNKQISNNYDVVFSVTESRRNPYFNMVKKDENGFYDRVIESKFIARQQAPEIFDMNASIYAYSINFLKNNTNIFDGNCGVVKMMDTGILDLDHERDFELMEVIAKHLLKTHEGFKQVYTNIGES